RRGPRFGRSGASAFVLMLTTAEFCFLAISTKILLLNGMFSVVKAQASPSMEGTAEGVPNESGKHITTANKTEANKGDCLPFMR
ncbi:MAG: hypothetical protein ACE5ER_08445, partial [Nitrospinaceae bacterium]